MGLPAMDSDRNAESSESLQFKSDLAGMSYDDQALAIQPMKQ
jgi:hypothetical protein